tara:strand:+ start:1388 stop:2590 length:1203 start_codon:yes stop_codon:yes gene_type:complete
MAVRSSAPFIRTQRVRGMMASADGPPLRVLLVHVWFWPHVGGGDQHVEMLGRELVKSGHDVTVWCADVPKYEPRIFDRGGIKVVRLPPSRVLRGVDPVVDINELSMENFDVIHLHDTLPILIRKSVKKAKKLGIPIVTTYHNDYIKKGIIAKIIKQIRWITQGRRTLHDSQGKIVLTQYFSDLLRSKGVKGNIDIIPNGFSPIEEISEKPINLPQDVSNSQLMTFIGRLSEQKGLDTLMDAWDILAKESEPNFDLAIAGKGELGDWLRERISKAKYNRRIHQLGLVSEAEKRWLLEESTGIVIPSRFEGLPTVMLEAMYAKSSTIMSDVNDLGKIVTEPRAGLSFEPNEPIELANAIQSVLLANPEQRERWGESGYTAACNYLWPEITKDVLKVYRRIIK